MDVTSEALSEPVATRPDAEREFTEIYQREFGYVWHALRGLGVMPPDLPDVTHDVFVAVYRALESYDRARPLRPWMFGVAYRVAVDHFRSSRRTRTVSQVEPLAEAADPTPPADQRLANAEERELVYDALGSLDLDRRAVLIMHYIDGHPIPEVARTFDVPIKTMYSRLRLARDQFVAAMRRAQLRRGDR
jgi:RNA polymerase sigma-70 factor (ECF subfamily)